MRNTEIEPACQLLSSWPESSILMYPSKSASPVATHNSCGSAKTFNYMAWLPLSPGNRNREGGKPIQLRKGTATRESQSAHYWPAGKCNTITVGVGTRPRHIEPEHLSPNLVRDHRCAQTIRHTNSYPLCSGSYVPIHRIDPCSLVEWLAFGVSRPQPAVLVLLPTFFKS